MAGKPKPRIYNCATCGVEHTNNTPKKVSRFCSRACTSRYQAVQFDRTKPDLTILSGRTKLIDGRIIVNEELYDWLTIYKWRVSENGYAVAQISGNGNGRKTRLHRLLMDAKPGQLVDHENRNKLDNRLSNLRFLSKSGNAYNSDRSDNARYYSYVATRGKWRTQIKRAGVKNRQFPTAAEAAEYVYQALPEHDR